MPPMKHFPLSASGSKRWIKCPGSRKASEGCSSTSSFYAKEGTAAHTLAERCLRENKDAADFLGCSVVVFDDDKDPLLLHADGKPPVNYDSVSSEFEVTEEMADAVQVYLDTVRDDLRQYPAAELRIEHRFCLPDAHPDIGGTCDAVLVIPFYKVVVYDYKHGRGVTVDAEENTQAMIYAAGAAWAEDLDEVEIVIVQPRAGRKEGGVKRWSTSRTGLVVWVKGPLHDAALGAYQPNPPLRSGDWCRFCPATALCPEARKGVMTAAAVAFDDHMLPVEAQPVLPDPRDMTPEQVSRVITLAEIIEPWIKSVEAYGREGLQSGRFRPGEDGFGFKLVQGKPGNRQYVDEDKAKSTLFLHLRQDASTVKLKSPAQAEKALRALVRAGGTRDLKNIEDVKTLMKGLVRKPEGALTMVPLADARPAVATSAAEVFDTEPLPASSEGAVSADDF